MEKRYMNLALTYAIIAMIFGVFYREFTKIINFAGDTTLSVIHPHYFILGMIFFLLLMIIQKNYSFSDKKTNKYLIIYNIGLNITGISFLTRGITQVLEINLTKGINASISGIAGIGHFLIGLSLILLLLKIRKKITK